MARRRKFVRPPRAPEESFWGQAGISPEQFGQSIAAGKEIPGALEELAETILSVAEPGLLGLMIDDFKDVPNAFWLLGRIAFVLERDGNEVQALRRIRRFAEQTGHEAELEPKNWYPFLAAVPEVYVSPWRMRRNLIMVRMRWMVSGASLHIIWKVDMSGAGLDDVLFMEGDPASLQEIPWRQMPMSMALDLMYSARVMEDWYGPRLVEGRILSEVLWTVVSTGYDPKIGVGLAYSLEPEGISPEEVGLALVNALSRDDALLVYDLTEPLQRPADLSLFLEETLDESPTGLWDLWRLWVDKTSTHPKGVSVSLKAWYWDGEDVREYPWSVELVSHDNQWYVKQYRLETGSNIAEERQEQFINSALSYYGVFPITNTDQLASSLPVEASIIYQTPIVTTYRHEPAYDYRRPFELTENVTLEWTLIEDQGLLLLGANEIAYNREMRRLRQAGLIEAPLSEGTVDPWDKEVLEAAAEDGWEMFAEEESDDEMDSEPYDVEMEYPSSMPIEDNGQCALCEGVYSRQGIARHVASCIKRQGEPSPTPYWYMTAEGLNWFDWLHFAVDPNITLTELHEWLRDQGFSWAGNKPEFLVKGNLYSSRESSRLGDLLAIGENMMYTQNIEEMKTVLITAKKAPLNHRTNNAAIFLLAKGTGVIGNDGM